MPGLRDIKRRIKSVTNIQQITKAMQMVAAAKVKKAQDQVLSARPYAEKVNSIFRHITAHIQGEDIKEPLLEVRPVKSIGLILFTSDKGLCGSYNTNIIRQFINKVYDIKEEGVEVKTWLIGNKAINFFKHHGGVNVLGWRNGLPPIPTYTDAMEIVSSITQAYRDKTVDKIILHYTKFVSMLKFDVKQLELLPIVPEPSGGKLDSMYVFEPSPNGIINRLLPIYLENQIYHCLLESAASELASRMTAMSTATKNAGELLDNITLIYNKARQTTITKEILEVVSGAEALK